MSGTQPIGNRFNMKLEMLEIERFYDQRAPSDPSSIQRDLASTPLSITYSQWVARVDPLTTMRITDTLLLQYCSYATL